MDFERDVKRRVAQHPRSMPGLVTGFVVTVLLASALRVVSGLFMDDPIFAITYVALVGGGLGATAMYAFSKYTNDERFAPIDFWANVLGDGDIRKYRMQGVYLHVTYGAIVGSFFPRLVNEVVPGTAGYLFAQLPMSLVTASVFAFGLFLLGLVYSQIGFFRLALERRAVGRFFANHVVYGLVLGLTTGLMQTVVRPLLDAPCCGAWPA
jgi:hypothetical protein